MSAGSASCAQDWSLVLRPWSCPSSPCQMTSWPTSHGSCLTQRQPVGLHKPAVQVIGSCAIGCQSYERNVRQLLRQLLRPRLQSEGHGAKLCTTALKHQRTVSTTAALLVTSRGARHVCGTTLRIRGAGKASKLSNHLQRCHPREYAYGALMTAFKSVHE